MSTFTVDDLECHMAKTNIVILINLNESTHCVRRKQCDMMWPSPDIDQADRYLIGIVEVINTKQR